MSKITPLAPIPGDRLAWFAYVYCYKGPRR
jgi:hypothetical protein